MATATRYVEGVRLSDRAGEGVQVTEPFYVLDAAGATPADRMYDARNATGLPALRTAHPTIPNVFATEIIVQPLSVGSDKVSVVVIWQNPEVTTSEPEAGVDPGTIFVSASLQEVETRFDRNGNQIVLQRDVGGTIENQPGTATVQIPLVIYGVERRETGNPSALAKAHIGRVNSAPIWGEDARRWLCTRLDGVSTDFGSTYTVNYEFQRSERLRYAPTGFYSSWDVLLVFEDDEGRPIENPVFGESMKRIEVVGESDFSVLGLPLT